jgi:hypothetical protein
MLSYVNIANSEPKHKSAGLARKDRLDSALTFQPPQAIHTKMRKLPCVEAQKFKL